MLIDRFPDKRSADFFGGYSLIFLAVLCRREAVVGPVTPPALYAGSLVGVSCLGTTLLAFSLARISASFRYQAMRHALNNFWLALLFNIGKILHT